MDLQPKKNPAPLAWETDALFTTLSLSETAVTGGVAVKINRAVNDTGRRFFSVELGRIHADGRFIRFLSPKVLVHTWHASVSFPSVAEYEALMYRAQEHIRERIQQDLYEQVDKKRQAEERRLHANEKEPLPGLKKIGKLNKGE